MWNRIAEWFRDRSERTQLLRSFNSAAREAFVAGIAPTLLRAKVSKGCSGYRHQFSDWLKSGFRIQAFTGCRLTKFEIVIIGETVLNDDVLVRRLVVLGFDTLEIHGDVGDYGCRWQLKDYMQLN
ncbi:MAG: hypothetical protein LBJ63_03325 [Prevotellaceae bacterium]|jgi:hypothetical protein|nr:hypothetical protein [Prevotellaceae bacterium]